MKVAVPKNDGRSNGSLAAAEVTVLAGARRRRSLAAVAAHLPRAALPALPLDCSHWRRPARGMQTAVIGGRPPFARRMRLQDAGSSLRRPARRGNNPAAPVDRPH